MTDITKSKKKERVDSRSDSFINQMKRADKWRHLDRTAKEESKKYDKKRPQGGWKD